MIDPFEQQPLEFLAPINPPSSCNKYILVCIDYVKKWEELRLELTEAHQKGIMQLNELDEIRKQVMEHTFLVQQQRKKWHDKFIKNKIFHIGDLALLFDSKFKDFKEKFTTHWPGPYEIEEIFDNETVRIKEID